MKADELFDAIGSIDESLVLSARTVKKSKVTRARLIAALAATLSCVLVIGTVFSFALLDAGDDDASSNNGVADNNQESEPADNDILEYASSAYFPIIQKLSKYYDSRPNNGMNNIHGAPAPDIDEDNSDEETLPGPDGYIEVTDNQELNVVEGDLLKRTDKYAFYLNKGSVMVYDLQDATGRLVASYELMPSKSHHIKSSELYLSEDLSTVTVFLSRQDSLNGSKRTAIDVISLDVSDLENISVSKKITIWGSDVETRRVNGEFILSYNYPIIDSPNYSVESGYVPQIDAGNGNKSIDFDSIIVPDEIDSQNYVVYMKIGESDLNIKDSLALLSSKGFNYASDERIFLVDNYTESRTESGYLISTRKSTVTCVSFAGASLEYIGSTELDGYPLDRYSLDEYGGYLRVVTGTSTGVAMLADEPQGDIDGIPRGLNANLYCIDLEDMSIVSSVIRFAPQGETVRSVRFSDNAAYVCTSVMLTDPVFFFDLTDINNITYKDTGTIPGFSTSLIDVGNGYLLGVGVSENEAFKLEIYRESEESVESVDMYEVEYGWLYSTEYKSYMIDRDNRLFGIALEIFHDGNIESCYIVFNFENGEISEVTRVQFSTLGYSDFGKVRAFVDDGYLFLFTNDKQQGLTVKALE